MKILNFTNCHPLQVNGVNVKAIFITNSPLQEAAYNIAESTGMMLIQGESSEDYKIVLHKMTKRTVDQDTPTVLKTIDMSLIDNSAGEPLNRPELKKAEFYDSKFLELINLCNGYEPFQNLGLFTDAVLKRISDMDFVSELIVQLKIRYN